MAIQRTHGRMIEDNSIVEADIANDAVTTNKIPNAGITDVKLATGITSSKLTGDLPAISGAILKELVYDIAFVAGYDPEMVGEDIVAARKYGEMIMARTGKFDGELGYIDIVNTGAALVLDIEKNGTSIYSTKPQFEIGVANKQMTAGVRITDTFAAYDRITFKVISVGSTSAGKGVRFMLKCRADGS
jgi:hypothetical protein